MLAKKGFILLIIMSVSAMLKLLYLTASVRKSAHNSHAIMYSFLAQRRVSIRLKLKILSFIEKLSGPDIGFYCYNFFPINNYEFYQYITNWIISYLLIYNLIEY